MTVDLSKNSNIASWNISGDNDTPGKEKYAKVIHKWLEFTKPINKLSDAEINVFGRLLYYRYLYSKDILNSELLDKYIFSTEIKSKVREDLNDMNQDRFQNIMSILRKKSIIVNNRIKQCYIPNIKHEAKSFKILFNFNILDDSKG